MNKEFKNVTIIGFGKVGSAFAFAMKECGYDINFIVSNHFENLNKMKKYFPGSEFQKGISKLSLINSDIIVLSVRDNNIVEVVNEILKFKKYLTEKIFFHTAGSITSDELLKLKSNKNYIGSMHPVQTFRKLSGLNDNLLKNIYFGIEGDEFAIKYFKKLSKKFDSNYIIINKKDKILYHIACIVASNFLVTQLFLLDKLFSRIDSNDVMKIFNPIISKTLENASENGIPAALTGPVQRNDIELIKKHLIYLKKSKPDILKYYLLMSEKTIEIAVANGSIKNVQAKKIISLIKKYSK